jgi:hypothetical protein
MGFESKSDVLSLESEGTTPLPFRGRTPAKLLLDRAGFLVGVDLGEEPSRLVVMIGAHEAVDRVVETTVEVAGTTVRIANARSAARAHEPNPHARRGAD